MTVISEKQAHDEAWIAVDFDGTIAKYHKWMGPTEFGVPIQPMVERVRRWVMEGRRVKIFTARVSLPPGDYSYAESTYVRHVTTAIQDYLEIYCGLPRLEVTCIKDYACVEFWDDRAVQVIANTGAVSYTHLTLPTILLV